MVLGEQQRPRSDSDQGLYCLHYKTRMGSRWLLTGSEKQTRLQPEGPMVRLLQSRTGGFTWTFQDIRPASGENQHPSARWFYIPYAGAKRHHNSTVRVLLGDILWDSVCTFLLCVPSRVRKRHMTRSDSKPEPPVYHNDPKFADRQVWANKEQSDQGLHCFPFCLHFLEALVNCKTMAVPFLDAL